MLPKTLLSSKAVSAEKYQYILSMVKMPLNSSIQKKTI
jgi:hypothetical protein